MNKKKHISFFSKYINGTKGVISIFLAILMVPFTTIAGALINAGRINSAVAIFDEALCNASNSALGTYDEFIRSRFGLMAMGQDTSKGGTQFGSISANYSADDFINDLFCYYMEQNLGTLSNTFESTEINAAGLHPLSDPDILLDAVKQSGKIIVPAKMVIDWGSLDDMVNSLTKDLNVISSIESAITSGSKVAASVEALTDKQETLEKKIDACNTAKKEYDTAYTSFKDAVDVFNTLVDDINYTTYEVSSYQQQVDTLYAQISGIVSQIESLERQIEDLRESGNTDGIETIEKSIAELQEQKNEIAPGYDAAVSNLNSAKSRLENYKNQFSGKRTAVVDSKTIYYNKIVALRDAVNATGTAAVSFQSAITKLVSDGVGLITDVVSTGLEIAKESKDNQKKALSEQDEYYKYQYTLATKEGYTEEATEYYNMLQENQSAKNNIDDSKLTTSNAQTVTKEAAGALEGACEDLSAFAERDLTKEYKTIYDALKALGVKINEKTVPDSYSRMSYDKCYYSFTNPVEKAEIKELIENLEEQIVSNGGWAVLQAIIGFIKAMFTITVTYDPDLQNQIDKNLYSSIGGLPSKKSYPITSPFDKEDSQKSLEYKETLNSFSDEQVYVTESDSASLFETILLQFDIIKQLCDPFKIKNLPQILTATGVLFSTMKMIANKFIGDGLQNIKDSVVNKALLVGYVSYNTANRTTYDSGKALTGASYELPTKAEKSGYAFSGAETEYIIHGSMNEKTNQEQVFKLLFAERLLFNIAPVLADATVQTLGTTIGAFTFGIGTVVTYVVFILVEGLVDAIILANGGDIPIMKYFVYITPTGMPKLLEAITSLKLSEALQKTVYEKASSCAYNMNENIENFSLEHGKYVETEVQLPKYDDYKAEQKKLEDKITNIFDLNYTKSLQLLMLLLPGTRKMTQRLADIIQMEASYQANTKIATYDFNLDKSYTYLRASGSFTSGVFIKVGDYDSVTSTKRVIYNGY